MVGGGADVRCHRYRREEIGGSPLDVDALEGVGIVGYPELVEPGQDTPVGTATAGCAVLNGEVRVGLTHAVA